MKTKGSVAAILLASGFSERFNKRNKLLLPFRTGRKAADLEAKPLARYTLELAAGMDFSGGIYFVAASEDVAALAADLRTIRVVKNTAPEKGLRESVRLGLQACGLEACGLEACPAVDYFLFFPCDEPFLDKGTVQRILDERKPGCIVEPRYRGRPGNPCLFSAAFRDELLALNEGETPKLIKTRYPQALRAVEVTDPLVLEDIDNEEDFKRLSRY